MCGRVARLCSGLATLLYHPDDTALALSSMPPDFRPQAMEDKTMWVTLVVGSPSRFYCVQHTCRHLKKSGFENIYWLRTPGATELDQLNEDPKKRVMMFWYTTVLPALVFLETHHGITRAFVVEDTCLLAPGVTSSHPADDLPCVSLCYPPITYLHLLLPTISSPHLSLTLIY